MHPLIQERITADPNVCFGKPVIKGTRVWVSLLLDFPDEGVSTGPPHRRQQRQLAY